MDWLADEVAEGRVGAVGVEATSAASLAAAPMAVPHWLQNVEPVGSSAPQPEQARPSRLDPA